jgi:outer membrane protein TolC
MRKTKWIPFPFLLILLFSVAATAQDTSRVAKDSLTVEQAVATALQNNLAIQLSRNDSAIAALDYAYRNAAFLPTVNANTGLVFNNNNQNQTLADGTKRNRNGIKSNNINANVGLSWTVFDGFRMFVTRERLGELVRLGELAIRQQVTNTVADVINTYYNIVRQKQQLKTIYELISINEDRYRLAQYRFDIGAGAKPDVLQAQIDLNAQRATELTQLTLIAQLKQQLNQLMNIAPGTNYEVSDAIPVQMNLTLSEFINVEASNPTLQIAQQNIGISELLVRERKAERFPTVAFNSAYNFNRVNNNAVINPFQPLFNQNRGLNYGLSASVPIFNGFNARRQIRQAELNVDFQELQYENQKQAVTTSVYNSFTAYENGKKAVTLEEQNIVLARENLFIARERYRLASTTFLELREAQRSLEDALNRLVTARYNLKVAETELLRLRGSLLR